MTKFHVKNADVDYLGQEFPNCHLLPVKYFIVALC